MFWSPTKPSRQSVASYTFHFSISFSPFHLPLLNFHHSPLLPPSFFHFPPSTSHLPPLSSAFSSLLHFTFLLPILLFNTSTSTSTSTYYLLLLALPQPPTIHHFSFTSHHPPFFSNLPPSIICLPPFPYNLPPFSFHLQVS